VNEPAASLLLADSQPSRLGISLGRLLSRWYRYVGWHNYDNYRVERIGSLQVLVTPTVANPRILRTGAFFARVLGQYRLRSDLKVLDLGTGSGICALAAAATCKRVVATDINPAAVGCTRINASMNRLEHRIDVRHGDLFEPVAGERFDLVLFNPPFLDGQPGSDREAAWFADTIPVRFAVELGAHLTQSGAAMILLSTFGSACARIENALRDSGFRLRKIARRRFVNETLIVVEVTPGGDRDAGT